MYNEDSRPRLEVSGACSPSFQVAQDWIRNRKRQNGFLSHRIFRGEPSVYVLPCMTGRLVDFSRVFWD